MKSIDEVTVGHVIWESIDLSSILYIGSAAEFFVHKDIDWLFFTGGFLQDPIIRGIHTTQLVRMYTIADTPEEQKKIAEKIRGIHTHIEQKRGKTIPMDSFLDVLFMSFEMGIRAYELVVGKLPLERKKEFFNETLRFGTGMHLEHLPKTYEEYLPMRKKALATHYRYTKQSQELFGVFRKSIGYFRYFIIRNIMVLLVDPEIKALLPFKGDFWFPFFIFIYKNIRSDISVKIVFYLLVPKKYHQEFFANY